MVDSATARVVRAGPEDDAAKRWAFLLRRMVGAFEYGTLTVELPSASQLVFTGQRPGRNAHISIRRWRAIVRLAFSGDIGFAESLADGDCASEDLKTLLLWAIQNTDASNIIGHGMAASHVLARLRHGSRTNRKANSRRNIKAHYDLGNAFYAAWLDTGMHYSSGIYENPDSTLGEAQRAKIIRVCELLDARSGNSVLEIGCGWGGLAKHLVMHNKCHFTGITLSKRQLAYAADQLRAFDEYADFRLQDYRDVEGRFERIVSIEMLEAVGETYWPVYFRKLRALLAEQGTAVLQVITIDEKRYEGYRRRPDFIQLNIFPGGMLPTKSIIAEQAQSAGLEFSRSECFGASYARTLADWRRNFEAAWPKIAKLGFDERFRRLWTYYFVYCEAGFEAGWLDVGLYQLRHGK